MDRDELISGLRVLLAADEDTDVDAAIRLLATTLRDVGVAAEITAQDDEPDDCNDDSGRIWVTSERELLIDSEPIATWTRCSVGGYTDHRQCYQDTWTVDEDTMGGDCLPDRVAIILDVYSVEDEIPDVPEPPKATDTYSPSPTGPYAVVWETACDDGHIVARYDSEEAATAVREEMQRKFVASNPTSDTRLCGYVVRGEEDAC